MRFEPTSVARSDAEDPATTSRGATPRTSGSGSGSKADADADGDGDGDGSDPTSADASSARRSGERYSIGASPTAPGTPTRVSPGARSGATHSTASSSSLARRPSTTTAPNRHDAEPGRSAPSPRRLPETVTVAPSCTRMDVGWAARTTTEGSTDASGWSRALLGDDPAGKAGEPGEARAAAPIAASTFSSSSATASAPASSSLALFSSRTRIVVAARCASLGSILPSGPKTRASRPGASAGETHSTSPATVRVPATGPTDPNRHVVPPREGGYPRPDNDTTVPPAEDTAEGVTRYVAVDEGHAATVAPSLDARAADSSVDANSTPTTRDESSWIQTGAGGRSHAASADDTTTAEITRASRSASSSPAKTHAGAGNPRRFRPKIHATSPPAPGPSRGYASNTLGARHLSASATIPIPIPGCVCGDPSSATFGGANRPARADPPPGSDASAYRISTSTLRGPVVHVIGATHTARRLSTEDARTHTVPM